MLAPAKTAMKRERTGRGQMPTSSKTAMTRRSLLKATLLSGSGLAIDFAGFPWAALPQPGPKNPLAGAERPVSLAIESLKKTAKPMGAHLMECAGNVRQARFGLLSVGNWAGIPVPEILDRVKAKSAEARVLVSGFDRYDHESRTSVPGA